MPKQHIDVILGCAAIAIVLVCILIYVAFGRANGRKENHNPAVVGLEGVVPAEQKRRNSRGMIVSPPDIVERAHKFRERARFTTIGKPEFRVSNKYKNKNIYKTLQSHPDFAAWEAKQTPSRRESEDRTSKTNSVWDDLEAGGTVEYDTPPPTYDMPQVPE